MELNIFCKFENEELIENPIPKIGYNPYNNIINQEQGNQNNNMGQNNIINQIHSNVIRDMSGNGPQNLDGLENDENL